jgi:hypothetical protein
VRIGIGRGDEPEHRGATRRWTVFSFIATMAVLVSALPVSSEAAVGSSTCPTGMVLNSGMCSVLFTYTGAPQTFTVPDGVSALTMDVLGAPGGSGLGYGPDGGYGGEEKATFPVTKGEQVTLVVGEWGSHAVCDLPSPCYTEPGGYGGGGDGALTSGGGGGGSFVFGPSAQLMIAAGGGGGDASDSAGGAGGNGGGTAGGAQGAPASPDSYPAETPATGGTGATAAGPGTGGSYGVMTNPACGRMGYTGRDGTGTATSSTNFGVGGAGQPYYPVTICQNTDGTGLGGGGGGGYFGGGSGGGGYEGGGGGGGGSGYMASDAVNASSGLGYPSGNGDITLSVAELAPTLSDDITFPNSPAGTTPNPNPGDTVPVVVTISAGDGNGDLSQLAFQASGPLQIAPSGAFSVVSGPTPAVTGPITLAPNSKTSFTYKLKAVKLGNATLTSNVSGQTKDGNPVSAQDQQTVVIGVNLKVDLTYTPDKIKIPLDKKNNPIPQPFALKVTVTNPFTKTITNVTLSKDPILELMGADIAIPVELDPKKIQPKPYIGTLAAGASKSITFAFLATTDGQGRVSWNATADNPDVPNSTVKGSGSVVVTADPTVILQVDLNLRVPPGGGSLVTSGDTVTVGGVLTNITNADVLTLDPLDPTLTGNAGGGNPIDPDNPPPTDAYPIPIAPKLGPGEVKAFTADVQTVVSAGTRGTIAFAPTGKVEKPDGSKADLQPDEIIANPMDDTETIHINDSAPGPATPADFTSEVAQFSIGFGQGAGQWLISTYDTVAWLLKSTPSAILSVAKAPVQLLQTIDYEVTYWAYLTPDARDQWYTEIATGILAQTTKLGKTVPEVKAKVDAAVTEWLNGLTTAWYAGDWNTVCNFTGQVSGNIALEAASWSIHLPEAADLIKLGDVAKESGVTKRVAEGLKALQAGDDLTQAGQALSKLYGMTTAQVEALQLLAKEKGLLIAARTRNPLSIQWEKLGALVKPEAIKIKNVDDIDAAFLGYRKVDEGSVVFKQPLTATELESSSAYKSASSPMQEAAQARLQARTKEWNKYEASYRQMAKPLDEGGGVNVAFDYLANGSALPGDPSVGQKVAFALDSVQGQGADYYIVKIAGKGGEMERVTGDIDLVAITKADGSLISPEERLDIYRNLQDTIDIQHGDTFSWLQNGELVGPDKASLLADHAPGGEPLAVFDPTGAARATYIQPKYTFFNTADKQGRIWYIGGYRTPTSTVYHFGQLAYPMFSSAVNAVSPWLTPAGWYHQLATPAKPQSQLRGHVVLRHAGTSFPLGGSCTWQYSADPNAGLVYPDGKGGLKQWTAKGGWQPLDITSCWYATTPPAGSPLSSHVLKLLPQTSLEGNAAKGVTRITLNGIHAVDPTLPSTTPWFAVGQSIVIDPGTKSAETETISKATLGTNTDTLTLSAPLSFAHLAGVLVSVAPAS